MKNTPYLRKGPRLLNNFKNEYMKTVYAFGQPVPEELLRLIAMVVEMSDRYRVFIRCGYGKYNYAPCFEVLK